MLMIGGLVVWVSGVGYGILALSLLDVDSLSHSQAEGFHVNLADNITTVGALLLIPGLVGLIGSTIVYVGVRARQPRDPTSHG